jgi:capsular exopolysaccharide synthesis family protein
MFDSPKTAPETESIDGFSENLLEIVWRRRWMILLASVLALVAAFAYVQQATPLYTSTSRIYVEQSTPRVLRDFEEGVLTHSTNYLFTQAELLKSTPILSAAWVVLEREQLRTFADVSSPMRALRRGLDTIIGKKDELISISFASPYPDEAAHVVNTVVDAYVTFHGERKRTTAAELLRILQEEKAERSAELESRLEAIAAFKEKNEGLVFGTNQDNNVVLRRLERLSTELTDAQLAAIERKSFYEVARQMADEPSGLRRLVEAHQARGAFAGTVGEISSLRTDLQRRLRQRADCLRGLKAGHPGVQALDAEIEQIREQIAELDEEFARNQLAAAQQEYLAALGREQELTRYFEEQRQQAISLNKQLSRHTILQSGYEQTRKLCDILDDRIKELSVIEETGALNISILEVAEPALEPSHPQKAKVVALALGLGLFAGVGLALVREWQDQRLHSTQEISTLLNLPLLGAIPSMGPRQSPAIRGQQVRINSGSREAEVFRTLRTAIFFGAPKEEARTILVTSPAPGEGKSTVTSNLGIAMAQAGQRVLILDADLRRPLQHKIFNLDRQTRGLSAVLAGQISLEDAVERTKLENLDILTCGPDVPNPAEMLNSEAFARVVKRLVAEYDRVLVDSPPIIAVTDALILAALCDKTVMVLRAEKSTRRVSVQACEALTSVGAKVLGIIVNDVPQRGGRYGYYGGYGYHGPYGGNGRRKKRRKAAGPIKGGGGMPTSVSLSGRRQGDGGEGMEDKADAPASLSKLWEVRPSERSGGFNEDIQRQRSV